MKRIFIGTIFVLGIAAAAASGASAAWVNLGGETGAQVGVLESSPTRIALEFTVDGFDRTDVLLDGRTYAEIRLPGEAIHLEEGLPELPLVARSVIIPDDRRMELQVVDSEFIDLTGIAPVPSKGNLLRTVDPGTVPYVFGDFYGTEAWYPGDLAFDRGAYILRDYRGNTVVVNPIRYQPSTGTLRVYTRMVVELVDAGPGGENVLVREATQTGVDDQFLQIYRDHFLNFGGGLLYNQVPEVGAMMIITYDDFASAVQPLVDWKNQMGVPTTMVLKSEVGTSASAFQSYIQSAYNESNDPKLTFVLLVGDAAQIPTPVVSGGASDPTYSKVAGSDNYPDIFVGRFSAENISQVQTQVERTINYESDPLLAGGSWYPRGVGIASNQGPGDDGEYDNQHIDNIRGRLLTYGYTEVDQIYDPYATSTMVMNAVNAGRTVINYCGHGSVNAWSSSGFSSTHVNQLVNDNMLPFIFSVACVNGQFSGTTCFAESWLRATHNGVPTGAIGAYMSSINQSWNPPMCGQDEANRLFYQDEARTYGSLCFNGSSQMMDEYGYNGVTEFNCWHVFGDPSLRYRTMTPVALTVTCPEFIEPDATTFEVDVAGVEGAICGLSYQGQFLGSALTDASGHAVIEVAGVLPEGEGITLTVTGYNRIPYITTIQVELPLLPSIVLEPSSFEVTVPPNSWHSEVLSISNMGEPGSQLNWDARFSPMVPGLWLTPIPNSGSVPYGESQDVEIRFTTMGMAPGNYMGQLVVEYNPSQMALVPVTLHVGDATSVDGERGIPARLELAAARPNPFSGETTLRFGLPSSQEARLAIYDAAGRQVRVLSSGELEAGMHAQTWDGRDDTGQPSAAGVYFARLEAEDGTLSVRMIRIR